MIWVFGWNGNNIFINWVLQLICLERCFFRLHMSSIDDIYLLTVQIFISYTIFWPLFSMGIYFQKLIYFDVMSISFSVQSGSESKLIHVCKPVANYAKYGKFVQSLLKIDALLYIKLHVRKSVNLSYCYVLHLSKFCFSHLRGHLDIRLLK